MNALGPTRYARISGLTTVGLDNKALVALLFCVMFNREPQESVILNALACNDGLVVMATGGGKSLCYQVPAIVSGACQQPWLGITVLLWVLVLH